MSAKTRLFSVKSNFDPFKILNIPRNASSKEIKAAYFKLAKLYHPDSRSKGASDEDFMQITKAYEMLSKKGINDFKVAFKSSSGHRKHYEYPDPAFYRGTFSTSPLYMSNGKMAGLVLLASALGGIFLTKFYLYRREQLRLQIEESAIESSREYDAVIERSKKTCLDAEIKKLEKRL